MSFQERWYQTECANALFNALDESKKVHPLAAMPTGSGKTIVLCKFIDLCLTKNPNANILILSHTKEILEQDYNSINNYFEGFLNIGIYSAGLDRKEIEKITVAGIQSVYKKSDLFSNFDFVVIDECHLISNDSKTMYQKFLLSLNANYIGLTATPFRTKDGYIYEGENTLFTDLVYDLTSFENYNRLVDEGFLSQLFSKPTALKFDLKGIKTIAGDFSQKDLSAKFDRDHITEAAILETIFYGKNQKRWLLFTIDIAHSEHVTERLIANGISAVAVHSKMENREQVLKDCKNGKYRAIVNVDVLTTGYDDPLIDLVVMLRATKSPIYHVQTAGRGARVAYAIGYDLNTIQGRLDAIAAGEKPYCLFLDFAGNGKRLGAINDVRIKKKGEKKTGNGMMLKDCPACTIENHLSAKFCINCGEEFITKEKISKKSSDFEIVKKKEKVIEGWLDVESISYEINHRSLLKPPSVLVTYDCGLSKIKEWVTIEHNGYAKHRARNWITFRWDGDAKYKPHNCQDLIDRKEFLKTPSKILVNYSGKYHNIKDAVF